ncbi:MAG: hypothetical protein ACW9W3_02365 [Candidatus Nitrosopumilus sp. bin_68KS]
MPRQSKRFEGEISKIESEYNIARMEAELEYHRKMSMTYGSILLIEQDRLTKITRRQRRTSHIQNSIRDAVRDSTGDESQ